MKATIYRGFQISPVFNFDNGKSDFQFARISDPEDSGIGRGTLEDARQMIDLRLDSRPEVYDVRISKGTEVPIPGFQVWLLLFIGKLQSFHAFASGCVTIPEVTFSVNCVVDELAQSEQHGDDYYCQFPSTF